MVNTAPSNTSAAEGMPFDNADQSRVHDTEEPSTSYEDQVQASKFTQSKDKINRVEDEMNRPADFSSKVTAGENLAEKANDNEEERRGMDFDMDDQGDDEELDALLNAYKSSAPQNKPRPGISFQEYLGIPSKTDQELNEDLINENAADKFYRVKKAYLEKVKRKRNTEIDDIEFEKSRMAEENRRALAEEREQDDVGTDDEKENPLFVPDCDKKGAEAESPKKKRKVEKVINPTTRSRKPKTPTETQTQKQPKLTKKAKHQQDKLANMNTLGGTNVFASAKLNSAAPEAPRFTSTKKTEAMKNLIASIPAERQSMAKHDKSHLQEASKKFGRGMCSPSEDGQWQINGMNSSLAHYQMIGASFMREREASNENNEPINSPAGGLQCDEMGLGKTVMAIAVIVSDRYKNSKKTSHKFSKPTLIVAPSSLLHQWRDEIYKHASPDVVSPVMIFGSGSDKNDLNALEHQAIVLTTYQQVAKSYPKRIYPVQLTTPQEKSEWWEEHFKKHRGVLHAMHWRRIIVDEATTIKNHRTHTSEACCELNADFRWALSGTPVMNCLDEIYAYFRFLRIKQVGDFKLFKKNFIIDAEGKERLVAFMRPFMLRRTHADSFLGSKLLNLPEPNQDTYPVQLDPLHLAVYRIVKERFIKTINVISSKGELRTGNVLTLLLRLRQFVGHPLLIQDCIRGLLEESDFERIEAILEDQQANNKHDDMQGYIIQHMRRMMTARTDLPELDSLSDALRNKSCTATPQKDVKAGDGEGVAEEATDVKPDVSSQASSQDSNSVNIKAEASDDETKKQPSGPQPTPQPTPNNQFGGKFGLKDDFGGWMSMLRTSGPTIRMDPVPCVRCHKPPVQPVQTSCRHTYCNQCMINHSIENHQRGIERNTCHACGTAYNALQPVEFHPDVNAPASPITEDLLTGKKPKDHRPPKIDDVINNWIDPHGHMLPSTKTQAFKAQVLNWRAANPDVKIIVYTQFVSMMKILARIAAIEHWRYLLYHGGMSPAARSATVRTFAAERVTLLFATLATGGVGLNLTMATRVVMVDPWWNSAVEQQAFCRTYRRGQSERTSMTRLAAAGTVDEHILRLQRRKDGEIVSVMGERGLNRSLPVAELLRLFGEVGEDENGNPFVYPEGEGPPPVVADEEDGKGGRWRR